jgi:F-type H+-transporting ATPase subunit gamma
MASTQEIFRRIKSVTSTRKVTRAMQMVSAAKMRKSQTATLNSRGYAGLAWDLIHSLYSFEPAELRHIRALQRFRFFRFFGYR